MPPSGAEAERVRLIIEQLREALLGNQDLLQVGRDLGVTMTAQPIREAGKPGHGMPGGRAVIPEIDAPAKTREQVR